MTTLKVKSPPSSYAKLQREFEFFFVQVLRSKSMGGVMKAVDSAMVTNRRLTLIFAMEKKINLKQAA